MAKFAPNPAARAMQALASVLIPRLATMEHLRQSIAQARTGTRALLVGSLCREYDITVADLAAALDALATQNKEAAA